jgi:hypothetical protein
MITAREGLDALRNTAGESNTLKGSFIVIPPKVYRDLVAYLEHMAGVENNAESGCNERIQNFDEIVY